MKIITRRRRYLGLEEMMEYNKKYEKRNLGFWYKILEYNKNLRE